MEGTERFRQLGGVQRAAAFFVAIGPEAASEIVRFLEPTEIEELAREIIKLGNLPVTILQAAEDDFYEMAMAADYIKEGGMGYAQSLLQAALGEVRAIDIIKRIKSSLQIRGFNVLKNVDPTELLSFLQREHPQTIALVLTQLSPSQAANIIANLPAELAKESMLRFARMERVSPENIAAVEQVLESRIDFSQMGSKLGGVKAAADILNLTGQSVEKAVLTGIAADAPELSAEIKNLMFVFEDVIQMDDRSIQKVLREVDNKDLTLALKACTPDLAERLLANISSRAAEMIREELEYMPPVRLREVEEVQQKIIDIIRRLEDEGQIYIMKGAEEGDMMI
ncbi:MAG: flagellar motor switch protein FliG [bacterium]|jgi:flagellar motor switch protein FliG|nr:flagellar motor switch protein FliG [bacterium]